MSYTTFAYGDLQIDRKTLASGGHVTATVTLTNTGRFAGDEVAQLYLEPLAPTVPAPRWHLEGFQRISLAPGESRRLSFTVDATQFHHFTDEGAPFLDAGPYRIHLGGGQPDDPTSGCLHIELTLLEDSL